MDAEQPALEKGLAPGRMGGCDPGPEETLGEGLTQYGSQKAQ